ncbi:Hypothetical protein NocV09_00102940 [Nannochloropsis oceanica]
MNDAVATELELLRGIFYDDGLLIEERSSEEEEDGSGGGNGGKEKDFVEISLLCRPRTAGRVEEELVQARLVLVLDKTSYPSLPPAFSLPFTPGLGDDEVAQVHSRITNVWRGLYGEREGEEGKEEGEEEGVLGCLPLLEAATDALDELNKKVVCSICLMPLLGREGGGEGGVMRTEGYYHCFHVGCLSEWWARRERADREGRKEGGGGGVWGGRVQTLQRLLARRRGEKEEEEHALCVCQSRLDEVAAFLLSPDLDSEIRSAFQKDLSEEERRKRQLRLAIKSTGTKVLQRQSN